MGIEPEKDREISRKTKLNYAVDFVTLLLIMAMIGTGIVIRYVLPPGSGGHGGGGQWLLWGLDRHEWGGLHFWLAVGITIVMLLHVALHWKWVCGVTRRWIGRLRGGGVEFARRTAYGVAFFALMVLLLSGFVYLSASSVEILTGDGRGHGHGHHVVSQGEPRRLSTRAEVEPGRALSEPHDGCSASEHMSPTRAHSARGRSRSAKGAVVRGSMTLGEVARESGMSVNGLKELLGLPARVSGRERLGRLKREYGFEIDDVRRTVATAGKRDSPPVRDEQ